MMISVQEGLKKIKKLLHKNIFEIQGNGNIHQIGKFFQERV